jgi:hypothetical protein
VLGVAASPGVVDMLGAPGSIDRILPPSAPVLMASLTLGARSETATYSSEKTPDRVDQTPPSRGGAGAESTRRTDDGRRPSRSEELALSRDGESERARFRDLEEPHFGGRAKGGRERRDGPRAERVGARDHTIPGVWIAHAMTQFCEGVGEAMQIVRRRLAGARLLSGEFDRSLATEE